MVLRAGTMANLAGGFSAPGTAVPAPNGVPTLQPARSATEARKRRLMGGSPYRAFREKPRQTREIVTRGGVAGGARCLVFSRGRRRARIVAQARDAVPPIGLPSLHPDDPPDPPHLMDQQSRSSISHKEESP